jgi:hypothetical protein
VADRFFSLCHGRAAAPPAIMMDRKAANIVREKVTLAA